MVITGLFAPSVEVHSLCLWVRTTILLSACIMTSCLRQNDSDPAKAQARGVEQYRPKRDQSRCYSVIQGIKRTCTVLRQVDMIQPQIPGDGRSNNRLLTLGEAVCHRIHLSYLSLPGAQLYAPCFPPPLFASLPPPPLVRDLALLSFADSADDPSCPPPPFVSLTSVFAGLTLSGLFCIRNGH